MNFPSINAMWDIPQAPSLLPDDDFLALLQKQFNTTDNSDRQPHSPQSDDSSPSPPSNNDSTSRRQSPLARTNDPEDSHLKRKASDDDMDPGPSLKNHHTEDDSNPARKSQPPRRKSTGNPMQDESRLLKRKEQNRAAQRAFRERKEKHVKDLEDKVAALEAKNEVTETENTNLRDLLSRLQEENLALKQAQFTFSVPKPAPLPASTPTSTAQPASFSFFTAPSPFTPASAPSQTASNHSEYGTDIDWNSLTTFDPSMLSVLDEPEAPMQTDTSQSPFGQYALPQSYKTIANNPLLMSFVDESPSPTSFNTTSPANSLDHFTFNFSSPSNSHSWTSTAQTTPIAQNNGQTDFLHQNHSLDELFGGNYIGNQSSIDFNALVDHTSMSPIASPPSATESMQSNGNAPACQPIVLSRTDIAKHILAEGPSPFTDLPNPTLHKTSDISGGEIISCQGANVPRTKESPENIEVLKAWRSITQSPHFKDADINELCTEFSKKARCDGKKMVLEPESVQQLFEHFKKLQQISTQRPQSDRPSS